MIGQDIEIQTHDGRIMMGYLDCASSATGPGLVIIHETFGVNNVMRDVAKWFGAGGFNAFCPDMYWRQQLGVQLTDQTDTDRKKAAALMAGFNLDSGIRDLQSTYDYLLAMPECQGKVGCVGYGVGGRLAYLMAARTPVDAVVGYYPIALEQHLGQARNISNPVMLHVAIADKVVPPSSQERIKRALGAHKSVTYAEYRDMNHAFARRGGEHFDEKNAEIANRRTMEFLKRHLA